MHAMSCMIEMENRERIFVAGSFGTKGTMKQTKKIKGGGEQTFSNGIRLVLRVEMKFHLLPASLKTEPYRMNEIISGDGANLF